MKKILSLGLVFIMAISLFATSFASSSRVESGGPTTLSAPIRIIGW